MIFTQDCDLAGLRHWLAASPSQAPFAPSLLDLGQALSRTILADPSFAGTAEAVALAFTLRRASAQALAERFLSGLPAECVAVPRGRCFIIAPGNVDSIFLHSWWLALLTGNRVAVRLPSRRSGAVEGLLAAVTTVLAEPAFAAHAADTMFLSYGRDDDVTALLSAGCDVRMIWGGDDTVATIRRHLIPIHASDLAFPDRRSLAAVAAGVYLKLDDSCRDRVAAALAADMAGFDQMACSSPRVLAWCGEAESSATAAADFRPRLAAALAAAGAVPATGLALAKLTNAARAAFDGDQSRLHWQGGGLLLAEGDAAALVHCGGGLLAEWHVSDLGLLAGRLDRRDQTLAHFGFAPEALGDLARRLNGRALDRMVPLGRALDFTPVWDGLDLAAALTRLVQVTV